MKFPEHKCGLYLKHNEHKDLYEPLDQWLAGYEDFYDMTPEDRKACIESNEFWGLQWYPETPVGFMAVGAPTLERLLEIANA